MAVNYNILNKISEKYVDQKLGEIYYYVENGKPPKLIKGKTKEEVYVIICTKKKYMCNFLYRYYETLKLLIKEELLNDLMIVINRPWEVDSKKMQEIYEELQLQVPNIDEMIIEYMDNLVQSELSLIVGKINELEEIE